MKLIAIRDSITEGYPYSLKEDDGYGGQAEKFMEEIREDIRKDSGVEYSIRRAMY
ncbi:hypothetical protein UF75_3870 [Desulfosporosinus sp. I2]|uniref:hypothetical protein n=1 Tax=Desulfosporosinus sp. I2 TaxID=1617025 RepID=UPI00061F0E09|nr:hypothetical protein [Desulfosporosinus sp. I2]KJR45757.1 hypothetical protein UF75_3870 [Desulfosporosinus sp. I2]